MLCSRFIGYLKSSKKKLLHYPIYTLYYVLFYLLFFFFQFAHFFLPQNATTQPHSSCGDSNTSNPILALSFGAGHLLRLNFSKTVDKYQVEQLTFRYNLSDTTLFHNSTEGKLPALIVSPFRM